MAKERTLKNLKVRVNKDGTLSKKSLEEIRKITAKPLGETLASRVTASQIVEGVGFTGLVAAYWYGFDLLERFLPLSPGQAEEVEDAATALAAGLGGLLVKKGIEAGSFDIPFLIETIAAPFEELFRGVTSIVLNQSLSRSVNKVVVPKAKQIAVLETTIRTFERVGATEEKLKPLREQLDRLKNPDEGTVKREAARLGEQIIQDLWKVKLAGSVASAYITKKFLESYEFSEAVENIPFGQ